MSSNDQERDRLRKLQERQLRDRDPGPRAKVEWKGDAARRHTPWHKLILIALPPAVKGALVAIVFGTIAVILMALLMPDPWGSVCGLIVFIGVIPIGIIVGRATDQGGYMD